MTPDDHLDELLGAYALDAVDDLERRRVEVYLAEHPEARAEVWRMRQAASMLAHTGNPAPDRIWDRIADTLEERPPALDRPLPAPKPTGRRRPLAGLLAAAAVLIAAAAGVVTALVLDAGDEPDTTQSIEDAYESARDDPEGRLVNLSSEDGSLGAEAVLQPDGLGFLSAATLPQLPAAETYQLWGVYSDGDVISLGVMGNRPAIEPFAAEGELDALVVTREAAGGVTSSTSGALLVGPIE